MTAYTLPALPYGESALEPHMSGKIVELHYHKHHAAYVKKANATLDQLDEAREKDGDPAHLAALERSLAFNLSGHILHSIFWSNLSPEGGGKPNGELLYAIDRDFGGFAKMKTQLSNVAATVMGSGWAALVWEPLGRRLLTTQIYDHQSNLSQGSVPLMVIDAWEHAYYLQYQNRKEAFFAAIWNLWNWNDVSSRFDAARGIRMSADSTTIGARKRTVATR